MTRPSPVLDSHSYLDCGEFHSPVVCRVNLPVPTVGAHLTRRYYRLISGPRQCVSLIG